MYMKNPEIFSQGQENLDNFLNQRSQLKESQQIESPSFLDGKNPAQEIQDILVQDRDYLALARMTGSDKLLEEIASHFGDEAIETQEAQIRQKNFFTDFVNYLRAERKIEELYLDSVRATQISDDQKRNGQSFTLKQEKRDFFTSLNEAEEILDEFSHKNPEVFIARNLKRLREYKAQLESGDGTKGRLVETPYVKKQLAEVESAIMEGAPIFIHGHLGSGKTEMALRAAYRYISKNKTEEEIDENIEDAYKDWLKGHPEATEKEKAQIKEEIRKESMSAVVISGSAETNTSDFTGHRTLNISDF
jgi:primosomal protein N'